SLKKLIGLFFVLTLVNNFTANIRIVDKITGDNTRVVANVPYVLAAFAGVSSQFGYSMATQFDTLFSLPYGGKYTESGLAMNSRFIERASKMQIVDPVQHQNMKQFVSQCVIFNGISKGKFSLNQINHSSDAWSFLKDNVSPRFGFQYMTEGGRQFLTCKAAAAEMDIKWDQALNNASSFYGIKNDSDALIMHGIKADIVGSYSFLANVSQDAGTLMKQNIMHNMLKEGALHGMSEYSPEAAMQGYAIAKAKTNQEGSMKVIGLIGSEFLTPMKIVIEALFYGIFPIVVLLVLLPGGMKVAKTYGVALFWMQSWAPLYAILNMVMVVYGKTASTGILKTLGTPGILTVQGVSALGEANSGVVAAASSAIPYIPMLSYLIFKAGAGALTQLSTSMMQQANSASFGAASEALSGQYSMGNTSFDTHQMHNNGGFSQDTNMSFRHGASSHQGGHGEMTTQYQDSTVFDANGAISNVGGNLQAGKAISASASRAADKSFSSAKTSIREASSEMASSLNSMSSLGNSMSHSFNLGDSTSHINSTQENSSITKTNGIVKKINDNLGLTDTEGYSLAANASVGASLSTPLSFLTGASAGASASTSAAMSNGKNYNENLSLYKEQMQGENFDEYYAAAIQESKALSETLTDSADVRYAQNIDNSYNESERHRTAANSSYNEGETYREISSRAESNDTSFSANLNQEFVSSLRGSGKSDNQINTILSNSTEKQEYMSSFVDSYVKDYPQRYAEPQNTTAEGARRYNTEISTEKVESSRELGDNFVFERAEKEEGLVQHGSKLDSSQVEANIKNANAKISSERGDRKDNFSSSNILSEQKIEEGKPTYTNAAKDVGNAIFGGKKYNTKDFIE
ncbi:MAG: hypothetical protein HOI53_05240, partial [Francisellaceae bacterium]|nr:hypothetical protein [Francisellaceae bacterium]